MFFPRNHFGKKFEAAIDRNARAHSPVPPWTLGIARAGAQARLGSLLIKIKS
jgi:hypothetical protein